VLSTLTLNSFYYLVEHYFDPNKEDTAGGQYLHWWSRAVLPRRPK